MSADQQEGALTPIAPTRVAEELRRLSTQRQDGIARQGRVRASLRPDDRRAARPPDRRVPAEILATLTPAASRRASCRRRTGGGSPGSSDSHEPGAASDVRPGIGRTDPEGRAALPRRRDGPRCSARGPRPPVPFHPRQLRAARRRSPGGRHRRARLRPAGPRRIHRIASRPGGRGYAGGRDARGVRRRLREQCRQGRLSADRERYHPRHRLGRLPELHRRQPAGSGGREYRGLWRAPGGARSSPACAPWPPWAPPGRSPSAPTARRGSARRSSGSPEPRCCSLHRRTMPSKGPPTWRRGARGSATPRAVWCPAAGTRWRSTSTCATSWCGFFGRGWARVEIPADGRGRARGAGRGIRRHAPVARGAAARDPGHRGDPRRARRRVSA